MGDTRSTTAGRGSRARRTGAALAAVPADSFGIPEDEFTPRVRAAVARLAGEAAALRAELEETRRQLHETEKHADQDHLLPVLNRRAFVRELTRFIAFSARYGTPVCLIYFDLDEFKGINDAHGHPAGDAVLGHIAALLAENIRDSDVVGRLGGDEFGVILTHADREQAEHKAAALARVLVDQPPRWRGRAIPLGFSFGVCELRSAKDADAALERADRAMYAHKKSARG